MRLIATKPRLSPPQSSLCVAGRLGFSIIATHFYWDNQREPLRRREKPRYRGGRKGVEIPQNRTELHTNTPNRFEITRKFLSYGPYIGNSRRWGDNSAPQKNSWKGNLTKKNPASGDT